MLETHYSVWSIFLYFSPVSDKIAPGWTKKNWFKIFFFDCHFGFFSTYIVQLRACTGRSLWISHWLWYIIQIWLFTLVIFQRNIPTDLHLCYDCSLIFFVLRLIFLFRYKNFLFPFPLFSFACHLRRFRSFTPHY